MGLQFLTRRAGGDNPLENLKVAEGAISSRALTGPTRLVTRSALLLLLIFSLTSRPAAACVLCGGGSPQSKQTLRQEIEQAKLVLYGTLENPRLAANTTDLRIFSVIKNDPYLGAKMVVELSRYVPVLNAKDPPKYLVFCDVFKNKLDPYRGLPVQSTAVVDYLKGALALEPKDRSQALLYFFRYLDNSDPVVAEDAFLEFAKANDREVGQVAPKLSPEKIRSLLQNPTTPEYRLGLLAFLLGGCGGEPDAQLLRSMIESGNKRASDALDGLLSGYIQLRPREGWDLAQSILRDAKRPFNDRFAVLRMFRFYHAWKAEQVRAELLRGLADAVQQGDIADLAIEDLRQWQVWDLTALVVAQFVKASHASPLVRRTIVRYALTCHKPETERFIADLRRMDAELVKEVEESLQFEKK